MAEKGNSIINKVMEEAQQGHSTRKHLYGLIEDQVGMPIVSFFTSFGHPVMIDDKDANMIEAALQAMDLSNGLAILISSPGGIGEAAERIINSLRSYSDTKEFIAIVPGKAKSAATMICLGASKIIMGPASELGPVDPQIPIWDDKVRWDVSAFHVVDTYRTLFEGARDEKEGNLQPFLQQLGRYDASIVSHLQSAIELSKDISIKALLSGMMKGSKKSYDEVAKEIEIFLTPDNTKVHGRPIFRDAAEGVGLNIESIDHKSKLWQHIYELYIRLNQLSEGPVSKIIETNSAVYYVGVSGE